MRLQDLLHAFLGLLIFPPTLPKSYTGSRLPLVLNSRSFSLYPNLNLAFPNHLNDLMRKPMSSTSARPLRSADRLDLLSVLPGLPWFNVALLPCHGHSSWNGLPHLLRAKLMSGISTTSSHSFLFPLMLPR